MDQTHPSIQPSIHPKDRKLSNLGWNLNLLQFTKFITIFELILIPNLIFMMIYTFGQIQTSITHYSSTQYFVLILIFIVPTALTIFKVIKILLFLASTGAQEVKMSVCASVCSK